MGSGMRIRLAIAALAMLSAVVPNTRAAERLPADVQAALRQPGAFQVRSTISGIPASVRTAFAKAVGAEFFVMAEPGARWQVGDTLTPDKPPLPARRLARVFLSKSFCILFYERGGIARTNHVAIFRLGQRDAELAWRAYVPQSATDPAALLSVIDKGQIHPPYDL